MTRVHSAACGANNLVNGKSGISPEMAIRLDNAFGGGAEIWLGLQLDYDLTQARKREGAIGKVRAEEVVRMALTQPPICEFGWKAPDFALKAVDGKHYALKDVRGPTGTLIVFICNHCPYVRTIVDRLVEEAKALQAMGIGVIAIMPNDTKRSPGDSFANMTMFAAEHGFTFPYAIDETQSMARAYDAVCTPDFFGFNAKDELQYRGRLDESKMTPVKGARRELYEAMKLVAETGNGPKEQVPSMGCSIKWS